jgi:hypothetical protein
MTIIKSLASLPLTHSLTPSHLILLTLLSHVNPYHVKYLRDIRTRITRLRHYFTRLITHRPPRSRVERRSTAFSNHVFFVHQRAINSLPPSAEPIINHIRIGSRDDLRRVQLGIRRTRLQVI